MAGGTVSLRELAREGAAYLEIRRVPSPRFDAEVLLALALGTDRSALLGRWREAVPPGAEAAYRALLERRGERIPLQHLTGEQEFWSLPFKVDARALIPRPETELIVEETLARNTSPLPLIVDVGTGCGILAVVLARELPSARIVATDLTSAALELARENASRHGVAGRIRFLRGNLAAPLAGIVETGTADFFLSNPPYIGRRELAGLEAEVRDHEPRVALTPGEDPLALYPDLIGAAGDLLRPGGHLLLEIPSGGADRAAAMVRREKRFEGPSVREDYSGIPRVLGARRR